jgi:hypothetical protein
LKTWLEGGSEPDVVAGFEFDPSLWREVSVRQRALYRATMALGMSGQPLDFHRGSPLTPGIILGEEVDDHHVFPQKFLKETLPDPVVDSVLNHTLIDKITNIRIGGRAPSEYLAEMEAQPPKGLGAPKVAAILESHGLPSNHEGPLFGDRFQEFLIAREQMLAARLEEVVRG